MKVYRNFEVVSEEKRGSGSASFHFCVILWSAVRSSMHVSVTGDFTRMQFPYKTACALSGCEATTGDMRGPYRVLAAKLERNRNT